MPTFGYMQSSNPHSLSRALLYFTEARHATLGYTVNREVSLLFACKHVHLMRHVDDVCSLLERRRIRYDCRSGMLHTVMSNAHFVAQST